MDECDVSFDLWMEELPHERPPAGYPAASPSLWMEELALDNKLPQYPGNKPPFLQQQQHYLQSLGYPPMFGGRPGGGSTQPPPPLPPRPVSLSDEIAKGLTIVFLNLLTRLITHPLLPL